jgi:hypothetical protein
MMTSSDSPPLEVVGLEQRPDHRHFANPRQRVRLVHRGLLQQPRDREALPAPQLHRRLRPPAKADIDRMRTIPVP